MKAASANLNAHIQQEVTTLATLWKIKRVDGTVFGFTDHDRDLDFDDGEGDGVITYSAATGYTRTAIKNSSNLSVANLDLESFFDSTSITEIDLRAGKWDKAEVRIMLINYTATADGVIKLRRGFLGDVTIQDDQYMVELRGLTQALQQPIGEVYTPDCRADLGDVRCGVRLAPPVWLTATAYTVRPAADAALGSVVRPTSFNDRHFKCNVAGTSDATEPTWDTVIGNTTADGGDLIWEAIQAITIEATVDVVTDRRAFTLVYAGDAPDVFLTGGLLTFLDGPNVGVSVEVKSWVLSTNSVVLFLPAPFTVTSGEIVTVSAGCDKTQAVCQNTFDNMHNFRGEPFVPGNDLLFLTPDAKQ